MPRKYRYWLRDVRYGDPINVAFTSEADARKVQTLLNKQSDANFFELLRSSQTSMLGFKMEVEGLPGPGRGPRKPGEDAWTIDHD